MNVTRIFVGIMLGFIVAPFNGVAGYGYLLGGATESAISTTMNEAKAQSFTKPQGNNSKTYSISIGLSSIALTKLGAFGLYLSFLAWAQVLVSLIIIFKKHLSFTLAVFLGLFSVLSLSAEIIGAVLSSSFGVTNAFGSLIAFMVGIGVFYVYKSAKYKRSVI